MDSLSPLLARAREISDHVVFGEPDGATQPVHWQIAAIDHSPNCLRGEAERVGCPVDGEQPWHLRRGRRHGRTRGAGFRARGRTGARHRHPHVRTDAQNRTVTTALARKLGTTLVAAAASNCGRHFSRMAAS
jgi:hypothetical protein